MKRWAALYYSAEHSEPAWNIHTSNTLGADLIRICRFSIDNKLDLSMVWILVIGLDGTLDFDRKLNVSYAPWHTASPDVVLANKQLLGRERGITGR